MHLYIRCWFILICVLPPQSCCWRCGIPDQFDLMKIWVWLITWSITCSVSIAQKTKLFEWSLPVDGRCDDTMSGSLLRSAVSVWKWKSVQYQNPQCRSLPLSVPLRWAAGCSTAEGLVLQQDVACVVHTVQTRWFTGTASVSPGLCRVTVTNMDPDSWRRRSTADYTQKHCVYSTYCSICTSIMQQCAEEPWRWRLWGNMSR